MKRILITGGSGYLGKNLALKLKDKYKVFLGSRNNSSNFDAEREVKCKSIPLDITNIESIKDALNFTKAEIVIHAAATKFVGLSEKQPFECVDVNILGSTNLARACIDKKIKSVIGISTDKATPPQKNLYGISKSAMERIFLNANELSNTNFLCVRFGNIAWSTGSVFPLWQEMFEKNKLILTTGPYMRRYFFSVDEASKLVIFAMNKIKFFKGCIVSQEMKAAQMITFLKVWKKYRGGNYRIIPNRIGDSVDETLIGENELVHTKVYKERKKNYFIIDYKKKYLKKFKSALSSKNAKKFSANEIKKILKI
ncbi:SDR family NAD(P)-dependent oxidoreductase [Pelagibacteraceae bacterium]|nr:SDR family NAD(P)-dependent oxidoreductase [Pelagibacteraceae bacterium]